MPQGGLSLLIGFSAPLALPKQPPSWRACPALPVTLHGGASLGVSLVGSQSRVLCTPPVGHASRVQYGTLRYAYAYMIALASLPMHTLHCTITITITTRQPPVCLVRWSSSHLHFSDNLEHRL